MQRAITDAVARRAAKRAGLRALKSRRQLSFENQGRFMLIEPNDNLVVAGSCYELSATEVVSFCTDGNPIKD